MGDVYTEEYSLSNVEPAIWMMIDRHLLPGEVPQICFATHNLDHQGIRRWHTDLYIITPKRLVVVNFSLGDKGEKKLRYSYSISMLLNSINSIEAHPYLYYHEIRVFGCGQAIPFYFESFESSIPFHKHLTAAMEAAQVRLIPSPSSSAQ